MKVWRLSWSLFWKLWSSGMRTGRLRRRGLGLRVGYPTIRVVLGLVEGLEWRLEFKLRLHVHLTAVSSIIPSILSSKLSESRSMPSRWSTSRPNMSRDASVTGVIVLTTATICSRVAVREFRTQSEECFECLSLCVHSDMLSTRDIGLDPHQRCSPPAAFRPYVGKLFAA